ncbi:hypothetical protein SDC9_207876 [bioreactor metagenome]|uniref:Uncharacterized protein n=1 Tax=bioreactor metagenome TaxID=1076179 RepID=A0A645J954_9ZZZZ
MARIKFFEAVFFLCGGRFFDVLIADGGEFNRTGVRDFAQRRKVYAVGNAAGADDADF